jgi:SHAQKYF class myb-like DNA-binding protein
MMMALDSSVAGVGSGGGAEEEEEAARVRKPYTITKLRESWTDPEHDKFLEALHMFDRDWRKIEAFVGSKTVIQIRSHAQKYFLKAQKNGTGEHLPPPRPKKKAAHPYPHKASKKAAQALLPQQASHIVEQECAMPMDASAVATNSSANDAFLSCDNALNQCHSPSHAQDSGPANDCSSSIESQSRIRLTSDEIEQEIVLPAPHGEPAAMPDFAKVYNFLGSLFDPETSGHLQKLREMDPVDAETALVLMKNLSMNISSPNFEAHRGLLSSHGARMDQVKHDIIGDLRSTHTLPLPLV